MGELDVSAAGLGIAPEPLLLLAMAMIIDGLWPTGRRPRVLAGSLGRLFGFLTMLLEHRLNRPARSQGKRLVRGAIVVVVVVVIAAGIGAALAAIVSGVPFAWIVELLLLIAAVDARAAWEDVRAVVNALAVSDSAEAQRVAAPLLGPDVATMDAPTIARHLIARLGERFSLDVVAPVFWFALLGLPGLLAMVAATAAARALPEQSSRFEEFGMAAARLRAALALLPAWLAALLIGCAAALTPGASAARAFSALGSGGTRFRAHGSSIAATAMTAAFNIAVPVLDLAKATTSRASARWSGNAGSVLRAASASDLRRAAYLYRVARILLLALVALLALGSFALL